MTTETDNAVRFSYPADPAAPRRPDAPAVVIDLQGIASDDHILRLIRDHHRFYESDLLEHLARHGPRGGVYVDVGANIGNHSVYFGRFLADHVVAVEPNPDLVPLLERNLRANGVARWTALRLAVGARPARGRLVGRAGFEGNAGAQRVVVDGDGDAPTPVDVDTLDNIIAGLGPDAGRDVRLVKLDIEGMELEALHGAAGLLEHQRPDIVVEAAADADRAGVSELLAGYGYRQIGRFCITPTYHFSAKERA